jgi:hypothetical protein
MSVLKVLTRSLRVFWQEVKNQDSVHGRSVLRGNSKNAACQEDIGSGTATAECLDALLQRARSRQAMLHASQLMALTLTVLRQLGLRG